MFTCACGYGGKACGLCCCCVLNGVYGCLAFSDVSACVVGVLVDSALQVCDVLLPFVNVCLERVILLPCVYVQLELVKFGVEVSYPCVSC